MMKTNNWAKPFLTPTKIQPRMLYKKSDAGRPLSKRPKEKNDCVVRAIAIAFNIPYDTAYSICKYIGKRRYRYGMTNTRIENTLEFITTIRQDIVIKYEEFPRYIPSRGTFILEYLDHVNTSINGIIYDEKVSNYKNKSLYGLWRLEKLP